MMHNFNKTRDRYQYIDSEFNVFLFAYWFVSFTPNVFIFFHSSANCFGLDLLFFLNQVVQKAKAGFWIFFILAKLDFPFSI